jgi:hypothetical protein
MVKEVLDGHAHGVCADRGAHGRTRHADRAARYGGDLGFDGKLDVAVFKGRFVYEHYDRLGPFQPVARGISRSSCASSTIVGSGSADGGDTTIGSRPIVIVNSSFVGSVAQRRGFTCSEGWSALEFINCDADDIAALPSVVLKRRPREGMILLTHAEEATERHDRINCIASLLIDHDVVNLSEMHTIASSLKMYEPFSVALDGDRPVHVAAPLPAKALHLRFTGIFVAYRCRTRRSSDYQIPPTALCIRPGIQVGTSCHAPPSWAHAPLS